MDDIMARRIAQRWFSSSSRNTLWRVSSGNYIPTRHSYADVGMGGTPLEGFQAFGSASQLISAILGHDPFGDYDASMGYDRVLSIDVESVSQDPSEPYPIAFVEDVISVESLSLEAALNAFDEVLKEHGFEYDPKMGAGAIVEYGVSETIESMIDEGASASEVREFAKERTVAGQHSKIRSFLERLAGPLKSALLSRASPVNVRFEDTLS